MAGAKKGPTKKGKSLTKKGKSPTKKGVRSSAQKRKDEAEAKEVEAKAWNKYVQEQRKASAYRRIKALKKYYPSLQLLPISTVSEQQSILSGLPNTGIRGVCDCIFQVLYSNQIPRRDLLKLKKLPRSIKDIARELVHYPRNSYFKRKRFLIKQSGGGIGAIIGAVLPLLVSLFAKSKK